MEDQKEEKEQEQEHVSSIIGLKQPILNYFDEISELYANSNYKQKGLWWGFKDLDKLLRTIRPGSLNIIAARPSMGKTSFVLNIATHIAIRQEKPILFLGLAEVQESITRRLLASEAPVDSWRIDAGDIENVDWDKMVRAADRLATAPLFLKSEVTFNLNEIIELIRHECSLNQISLVIIDYMQLINGTQTYIGNRTQEISEIARSLKQLAMELNISIIAVSQLSRNCENRQVKKPILSDLRDSGSIEDDADVIIFIYREDYYDPECVMRHITDVIVAKNRFGPTDCVQLFFHNNFGKFSDLAKLP